MAINVVNPFKSQTSKLFGKSKNCCCVPVGDPLPSGDIHFGLRKMLFKLGTPTTLVGVKAESFNDVKPIQSSSLLDEAVNFRAGKKNIISKVKSAKNIAKLFTSTGRGRATVSAVDPYVVPGFEDCSTADYSSVVDPSPIVQHLESNARVFIASDSILPSLPSSEAALTSGKNDADEIVEDLTSESYDIVKTPSPSPTGHHLVTPVSPSDGLTSAPLLNVQRATAEGGITLAALNTELTELSSSTSYSTSYISWSSSGSAITVYFSSNSLSAPSTANDVSSVSSCTDPSPIATSFATSVDAEDHHQPLTAALRRLRRVRSYEDLRNPQITSNYAPLSNISSVSSHSDGVDFNAHTIPSHGYVQYDSPRKSFLPYERKIHTSPIRQAHKFEKLRTWLITRCHEASHNTRRTSTTRVHSERRKVTSVSPSRQFLQGIFRPSARIRGHVPKSAYQPLPPSSIPVWSCAKITRSSSKTKRRQKMTKRSMRELKARLDSMDIDSWY